MQHAHAHAHLLQADQLDGRGCDAERSSERVREVDASEVLRRGVRDGRSGRRLMTGAENPPPSNFRRLVLGCIEAKFCK